MQEHTAMVINKRKKDFFITKGLLNSYSKVEAKGGSKAKADEGVGLAPKAEGDTWLPREPPGPCVGHIRAIDPGDIPVA